MKTIHVALPAHLKTLAGIDGITSVRVPDEPTIADVLDAVEARFPMLQGTIRDHGTLRRRAFMRYFASEQDFSHHPPDTPLPAAVAAGDDVFRVVGAIAGG